MTKRMIFRSALAMAAFWASSSTWAICDGCVVAELKQQTLSLTSVITSAITGQTSAMTTWGETRLMPGILGATQTISQSVTSNSKAAQENAVAIMQAQQNMAADQRYHVTNPCAVGAMSVAAGVAIRSGPALGHAAVGGGRGALSGVSRPSTSVGKALAVSEGKIAAPDPRVAGLLNASAACSGFATGVRASSCTALGLPTGVSTGYADADVTAATVIDGPQVAGSPMKRYSLDLDPNSSEELAVSSYMRNLDTPIGGRALRPDELNTDAGRAYLAVRDVYDARMSMARRPIERHLGNMRATPATIGTLNEMVKGTDGAWVLNYLKTQKPNWQTKGVGADELLNLDVERRYYNLSWLTNTASMPPEEVAREQLRVSALQNALLWRLIQETTESGLVQGQVLASLNRQEMNRAVEGARAAAAR